MSVDEPRKEKVSYYVLPHTDEFQIERNIFSWMNQIMEKSPLEYVCGWTS